MASARTSSSDGDAADTPNQFDVFKAAIRGKFNRLHLKLTEKEQELLDDVSSLQQEYEGKRLEINSAIQQIENLKLQIHNLLKSNLIEKDRNEHANLKKNKINLAIFDFELIGNIEGFEELINGIHVNTNICDPLIDFATIKNHKDPAYSQRMLYNPQANAGNEATNQPQPFQQQPFNNMNEAPTRHAIDQMQYPQLPNIDINQSPGPPLPPKQVQPQTATSEGLLPRNINSLARMNETGNMANDPKTIVDKWDDITINDIISGPNQFGNVVGINDSTFSQSNTNINAGNSSLFDHTVDQLSQHEIKNPIMRPYVYQNISFQNHRNVRQQFMDPPQPELMLRGSMSPDAKDQMIGFRPDDPRYAGSQRNQNIGFQDHRNMRQQFMDPQMEMRGRMPSDAEMYQMQTIEQQMAMMRMQDANVRMQMFGPRNMPPQGMNPELMHRMEHPMRFDPGMGNPQMMGQQNPHQQHMRNPGMDHPLGNMRQKRQQFQLVIPNQGRSDLQPPFLRDIPASSPWCCQHCTFSNLGVTNVCDICSKSRDLPPDTSAVQNEMQMQPCQHCRHMNLQQNAKCSSCNRYL